MEEGKSEELSKGEGGDSQVKEGGSHQLRVGSKEVGVKHRNS